MAVMKDPLLGDFKNVARRVVIINQVALALLLEPAPLLGFLAGHKRLTDRLGAFENPGLNGFVFAWLHE